MAFLKGHVVFMIYKINVTLFDVTYWCLIHMQRRGTLVNGRSTACHGPNLIRDLNQKVLKFLFFLSSSFFYLSVFVLEPLLLCFLYCSIVQLMLMEDVVPVVKMFACFDSVRIFYILFVVVQSYPKWGFQLSDILYFAEHIF